MPTSVNVNELPSLPDRIRGFVEDWKGAAIQLLIGGGLIGLVAGMIYLNAMVGPAEVSDLVQVLGP